MPVYYVTYIMKHCRIGFVQHCHTFQHIFMYVRNYMTITNG